MGPLDRASRCGGRAPCSPIGIVLLGALVLPAVGIHLGMPGARVVDQGHTSRDGYDTLVQSFGPGAAAPVFITVPAADAPHGRQGRVGTTRGRRRPRRDARPRHRDGPSCG